MADADRRELERCGAWHNGEWKGEAASKWRMTPEAVAIMDDYLIDQINATVGEDDELWHLGDFAMAPKPSDTKKHPAYVERCEGYRARIKCKNVNIIWGNHDLEIIGHLFKRAGRLEFLRSSNLGCDIVVCHYPFAVWHSSHRAAVNLYGHCHTTAENWLDTHMPGRRAIDVGVDNAKKVLGEFRPFSEDTDLVRLLGGEPGFSLDHHVPRNSKAPRE